MCVVRCGTHRRPTSASRRWKVIKALCCHWLSMAIDYSVVPRIARFLYELHSTHFIHIHSCLLIARHVCHWSEPRKTSGTWFSNILVTRNLSHWFVHMQVCHVIEECSDLCRCVMWLRSVLTCAGVELGDVWTWKDDCYSWSSIRHTCHCARNVVRWFSQSHQGASLGFNLEHFNATFWFFFQSPAPRWNQHASVAYPSLGCYCLHSLLPFIVITQVVRWCRFCWPIEGARLSWAVYLWYFGCYWRSSFSFWGPVFPPQINLSLTLLGD